MNLHENFTTDVDKKELIKSSTSRSRSRDFLKRFINIAI